MRIRIVWYQLVPAFIIVGALWVTIAFRPSDSGIDVHVTPAPLLRDAQISVRKAGRRDTLGTERVGADGAVRFELEPGRYVVSMPVNSGVARRWVLVRDDRYARVTIAAREAPS